MLPLKYFSLFSRYKIGIVWTSAVLGLMCGTARWIIIIIIFLLDGKAFELVIVKHKGFSSNVCMFCFLFVFFFSVV